MGPDPTPGCSLAPERIGDIKALIRAGPEAGQAVAVAAVRYFPQEGLQMFAGDGVEDGVLGVAGLIGAMGMRHALG